MTRAGPSSERVLSGPLKVLVTGAFGSLGLPTVRALLRRGHEVRCFDRPGALARVLRLRLPRHAEVLFGDIRDGDAVERAVRGRDAVVHYAAVLPPASERSPGAAEAVNVGGTRNVLRALGGGLLVYPSSVAAYGPVFALPPPRTAACPLRPTDAYTRHKAACEALVREQCPRWVILRIGVALSPLAVRADASVYRDLVRTRPDNRLEYIHPEDVALAVANLLAAPTEALGRILLLGGGQACRIRQRDLLAATTRALGLEPLPDGAFGALPYYTDWLDTRESQELLRYQRHTFGDFEAELRRLLAPARVLGWPLRPLATRLLLRAAAAANAGAPR